MRSWCLLRCVAARAPTRRAVWSCADVGLDTEVVVQLRHVRVELGIRNHVDDAAVIHHVVPVRDGRGEAEVLLDEQDREALRLELARSCGRSAGRSPAPGPRSARPAAAAARRCAGCARSRASAARRPTASCPGCRSRSFRFGNSSKICATDRPPSRTIGGSSRFSSTSRLAKMPRSSGQYAMPRCAIRLDASVDDLAALEGDRALAPRHDAHDRPQRGRLAGAVAAEQRHDLAGRDVERHAVQHVGFAVPGVEIAHGEERGAGVRRGAAAARDGVRSGIGRSHVGLAPRRDASTRARSRPRPALRRAPAR